MDHIIGQTPRPAGQAGAAAAASSIIDGDQRSFMQDVIEASRTVPVLVDFWATWCGPCKTLTPILERVVTAAGGRLRLVKIDIDRNAALVQQLGQLGLPIQSVPMVAAFWQGQIADMFQGALPESEIKRFAEALLKLAGGAMPTADLLAAGKAALDAETPLEAADLFSAVLQADAENPEAWGGLVRALLAAGELAQAEDALAGIPPSLAGHAQMTGARAAVTLALEGRSAARQRAQLEKRVASEPTNHQARFDLASALNGEGRRAEAADALLHIMRAERGWNGDAARQQLLKFFEAWGFDDKATMAARRKLSALLFS